MGVYADKYFGYFMNVLDDYLKGEDMWDKFIDSDGIISEELKELRFVPYYARPKHGEGDITLLYDGMCGNYAKLVFVQTVEFYSADDSYTNEKVNEILKSSPVPTEVREQMEKVYDLIFGKPKEYPPIYLKQFTFFH